jgi:hypothetical protein
MHSADEVMQVTPAQIVWGLCTIGSGDMESCHACVTNPPTAQCEWNIVPR